MEQQKQDHRDSHGESCVETLMHNLRKEVRQLLKSQGFTAAAVLTLALGIAVNATMFSLVSAFLLRRPPGREPDRVAVVSSVNPAGGFFTRAPPRSAPNFPALREAQPLFSGMRSAEQTA